MYVITPSLFKRYATFESSTVYIITSADDLEGFDRSLEWQQVL